MDCEFLVHFLQLRENIALKPGIDAAIAELSRADILPNDFGAHFAILAKALIAARLLAPDGKVSTGSANLALAAACGQSSPEALMAQLNEARIAVAGQWARNFGEELEIVE